MNNIIQTATSCLATCILDDNELLQYCITAADKLLVTNPPIRVFGKSAIQHRGVGFFSNESKGYYYSRQFAKSIPLSISLQKLLNIANSLFKAQFNGILINRYMDGGDYISAHSDDEQCLDDIGVVSISYGAIRNFRIRDKQTKKIVRNIPTSPNMFIHMAGDFQKEFTHEIPIQKKIKEPRWSFTFRKHNN